MNFSDLDDLIHSGVTNIVLDSDVVLDSDEKSRYLKGIVLDVDGLVIDGAGHTVDARRKARIFHCRAEGVVLKNFTFKRGFSVNGGAIYNDHGDLNIENSRFEASSSKKWGGAIYNSGDLCFRTAKS